MGGVGRFAWISALAAVALAGCGATGGRPADPPRGGPAPVPSLRQARAVIWAVGDGADGSASGREVAARIGAGRVDRLLYLGDVYPSGTRADFDRNYVSPTARSPRRPRRRRATTTGPTARPATTRYWRRALQRRPAAWYAFDAAGWKLLSLNSEAPHDRGSPQERWLRTQVRTPGTCRIVFWHRPRYSAGTVHGDQADMAPLWDDLRGRAAIALAGHEHDMQRFKPIDGITEFVSGAGGAGLYAPPHRRPRAFADDREYGALRLVLTPGAADYAFVAADGRVLDHGTIRCRG